MLHSPALEVLDGQVQAIRSVIDPDELAPLGPVTDAWDVGREVGQARRRMK
ncbi:hypothetical protein [Streptomyces sp. NTH33]|uniref:hypothetical protein n=1 Tax=Streptomyces sp. NTH33 TaxID=1735453 RepID=UPI0015E8E447